MYSPKKIPTILVTLLFIILSSLQNVALGDENNAVNIPINTVNSDSPEFFGLAAYYNTVKFYLVSSDNLSPIEPLTDVAIEGGEIVVGVGRSRALVIEGIDGSINIGERVITLIPSLVTTHEVKWHFLNKSELHTISNDLAHIRYTGLWGPFAYLARAVEWLLVQIQGSLLSNWGLSILILALVIKIILLPLAVLTSKAQQRVSKFQSLLDPKLSEIKATYKGEEAHNRIMAAHKELGISPLFTLKPLLATLIQIPILIAVFNALGEMPQLIGSTFLWIKDLSFPDSVAQLPISIPLLGNTLNLLPIFMTFVSITSTILFRNRSAPSNEVQKQKRNLFLMSAAFFVLFYPFPAAMVLYWTASNALHIVQQRLLGS